MFFLSAGHVADMLARMKNNRALRKKKSYYSEVENHLTNEKHQDLEFRKVSPEQKKRFFQKIRNDQERQRGLERITLILFIVVFLVVLIWFLKTYT